MLCSAVKNAGIAATERKKCREKQEEWSNVSPSLLSAQAVSQVFYNRAEHSKGFSINLFYDKESIEFLTHHFLSLADEVTAFI